MREIIKPTVVLGVICLTVGLLLSFANNVTSGIVFERTQKSADDLRREVITRNRNIDFEFVRIDDWKDVSWTNEDYSMVKEVYKAVRGETVHGYVITVCPKGFGGEIEMMVGVSSSGMMTGVEILSNNETPGLGSKVAEAKYTAQFRGIPVGMELKLIKNRAKKDLNEVQAVSGATVSSEAVTSGAQVAMKLAKELIVKR